MFGGVVTRHRHHRDPGIAGGRGHQVRVEPGADPGAAVSGGQPVVPDVAEGEHGGAGQTRAEPVGNLVVVPWNSLDDGDRRTGYVPGVERRPHEVGQGFDAGRPRSGEPLREIGLQAQDDAVLGRCIHLAIQRRSRSVQGQPRVVAGMPCADDAVEHVVRRGVAHVHDVECGERLGQRRPRGALQRGNESLSRRGEARAGAPGHRSSCDEQRDMVWPHGIEIAAAQEVDGGRRLQEVDPGGQSRRQTGVEGGGADPLPGRRLFGLRGVSGQLPQGVDDEHVRVGIAQQRRGRARAVAVQHDRGIRTHPGQVPQPGSRDQFVAVVRVAGRRHQVDHLAGTHRAAETRLGGALPDRGADAVGEHARGPEQGAVGCRSAGHDPQGYGVRGRWPRPDRDRTTRPRAGTRCRRYPKVPSR